jgi:predicted metal-dependent phosphoesterase TrpH
MGFDPEEGALNGGEGKGKREGNGKGDGNFVTVDMHLHTSRSFDSLNDPLRLLDAADANGIDILCVTDHNEIATALMLKERYPERIIVGEEVKTGEGVDVIGLFIHTHIPKGTPARRTCDLIHEQGGLVYVPHPFAKGKGGGGRILSVIEDQVDAVEGFNARLHDQTLNEQAVQWGATRGLPLGAGSDAHTLTEIGRGHVEMPGFADNPAAFRAALATAKIHGRESSRLVHVASTYAKLHKLVFKPIVRD